MTSRKNNDEASLLSDFYRGFFIKKPLGNNAFSYHERKNKSIYVAPLMHGDLRQLAPGTRIAFSEIEDHREFNKTGLAYFHFFETGTKTIFIFDNHNHAFFFWMWGFRNGRIQPGATLVHVDQHSDMREPEISPKINFEASDPASLNLQAAFEYTNFTLNVGNFIKPALKIGLFSNAIMINSKPGFEKEPPAFAVLDIDIDIFAPEMNYIPHELKMARIRGYIETSHFITIATSPFFIDQKIAVEIVLKLLTPFLE